MRNKPQIFRPNKVKTLILFLGSAAFVALGFFVIEDDPLLGWSAISFFGLGVIISLLQLYPNSTYLKLTDEGFEVKGLFHSSFTKWTEVKGFRSGQIKGTQMIFFDYTDSHKKWTKGKKVAKFLSGGEGAVPSVYNIPTTKLIVLMTKYQLKHL